MELGQELNKNIVTAVHPIPRFGCMNISPDMEVVSFSEKFLDTHSWINGGFMYLKPDIFKYFVKGDDTNLESDVMPKLVWESGLYAFQYENYWHCVDALRDLLQVNEDYKNGLF
jgi:glucose-1-phosphate cytidylyltransferase